MKRGYFLRIYTWYGLAVVLLGFTCFLTLFLSIFFGSGLTGDIIDIGIGITGYLVAIAYFSLLYVNNIQEERKKIMYACVLIIVVCCVIGVSLFAIKDDLYRYEKYMYLIMEIVALVTGIGGLVAIIKHFKKKEKERTIEDKRSEAKKN